MNFLQEFNSILKNTEGIALATSVNNTPNVRIINYCYSEEIKGVVYFSTFKDKTKTTEFSQNNRVSFTTIPNIGNENVRTYNAVISKGNLTIYDLKDMFINKYPSYEGLIKNAGNMLQVYEINFNSISIILGIDKAQNITLE